MCRISPWNKKTFIVPAFASNGLNIFSSPDLRERGLFEIALPQSSWNTGRETFVRLQTGLLCKIISLGFSIFFSLVGNIMKFTLACALQFALQARLVHFRLDSNLRRKNYEMQCNALSPLVSSFHSLKLMLPRK